MEEIFPKVHSFLKNQSPINQQSSISQCNSLRYKELKRVKGSLTLMF
jgi:hypothetical protein